MRNIKLTISYDGTNYRGWQVQARGKTVQGEIERALLNISGKKHGVHGAGRTDSGVHANAQVAHFKTALSIPEKNIPLALNSVLPEDIAVIRASYVNDDFHARFDARSKHYRYHVYNSRRRDPFKERYSWRVPYELDVPLMRKEAGALIGRHDFKAFQARDKRERTSVRNISRLCVTRKRSSVIIDISADGFLYNMVRNIVGTLIDTGRGYLPGGSMKKILKSRDRTKAGPTAPARGLFLVNIRY